MDPEVLAQYKKNADTFRQRIDDICEKYATVEDPGFDLCLETMTFKTRKGTMPAESLEANTRLDSLQDFAEKNVKTLKDLNNTEDKLVFDDDEDEEVQDNDYALERGMESNPGQSLFEASHVSCSLLSLPEEQDPELERTFSSQSEGPSLQDLYPSMLSQIRGACQRQQVSEVANSLRRKYHRQRWKAKRLNPGQSFINSSGVSGSMTSFAHRPLNRKTPKASTEAPTHSHQPRAREAGSGQRSSPWKSVTSQGAAEQRPVLVMDFSTPPSSGPSSPSDTCPELDTTYTVRTSPSFPHASHHSEQQVRKQEPKVGSFHPNVVGTHASQPFTVLYDARNQTQVCPSPKRRNYEASLSSPSKVNSVLNSPSYRHHNRPVLIEDSPPRQQGVHSSPRHFAYAQHGLQETHDSSPHRREALWTSPTRSHPKTHCPTSPQQPSPKPEVPRCSLSGLAEAMPSPRSRVGGADHNPGCSVSMGSYSPHKRMFLSREAPRGSPSKSSPGKQSTIRTPYSTTAPKPSSLPRHPEIFTSPSHRHHQNRDLQENFKPSPSHSPALQTRRRSFSGPRDAEHGPAGRLSSSSSSSSSSIPHVNQQFRQLYHQHVCQGSSRSLSHHGPLCCLCEQSAEGRSPSSRASPATTPASTTHSWLAALSLTPVRRRRLKSDRNPLLKHLLKGQQVYNPLVERQHWQEQQERRYAADDCYDAASVLSEMSDESQSPVLDQGAQTSSSGSRHHHAAGSSSSSYSLATLAVLGLAPSHPRLSKRRSQSEPHESPSFKRFRESAQALSPSKPCCYPQHHQSTQVHSPSKPRGYPQHHQSTQAYSPSKRHGYPQHHQSAQAYSPSKRHGYPQHHQSAQVYSPSKRHGYPQQHHHHHKQQQQWGGGNSNSDEMMASTERGLSEEQRTRSRALLLQCPSPRFLRAAMRLVKSGRSRARPSLGTRPHASSWRRQQDQMMHDTEGMSEEAWNESGLSHSVSRRRLLC
ncbi:serine/arginine repetitive matrix protein 2 isoform X2 [Alosa alosa]|uniref:serine/arginine repetitive matrix protein 2 isoform X2 n=1 Tax=Alosa alosa TaxID=278164 RepID=UPI0020153CB3|nr:serine/arginine repetitive matrix protein 2 isoform X2 [Alosa alosa]